MTRLTGNTAWLALITALLAGCGGKPPDPPEAAVRAWIAAAESAAEQEDRAALMQMISPSYADARGNDRGDIGSLFRLWFMRMNNVSLLVKVDDIALYRDTAAEASLTVGLAGTGGGTFGLSADAYRFELELESMDDEWRLIGARWGEIGQEIR